MDMQWFLFPISKNKFVSDYLDQKPFINSRNQPEYYARYVDLADIDNLLRLSEGLCTINVQLKHPFKKFCPEEYTKYTQVRNAHVKLKQDVQRALELLVDEDATIQIDGLQNVWSPANRFEEALNRVFNCRASTTVLISSMNSPNFHPQYETCDMFILPVSGKRLWKIFSPIAKLPLGVHKQENVDESLLDQQLETVVKPGDLIYIPRGFVYRSESLNEYSVELRVRIGLSTWTKFLVDQIRRCALSTGEFRNSFMAHKLKSKPERQLFHDKLKQQFLASLILDNFQAWQAENQVRETDDRRSRFFNMG
jgi:ribosomal protein L16 Arg81 hydroxylase